jgi:DNA-binding response OmpR family regulator
MRILLADDDRDLVRALAKRCRTKGFSVATAYDGFTALSLARNEDFDVICLDIEMPGGNGAAVSEMLVSDPSRPHTPIIMLTGREDPNTVRRCHALGTYYVPKCADVWERIGPLLDELTNETPAGNGP